MEIRDPWSRNPSAAPKFHESFRYAWQIAREWYAQRKLAPTNLAWHHLHNRFVSQKMNYHETQIRLVDVVINLILTMIGRIPPASDILHRSSRMHTHTQTHTLIQWNCLPFSLGRIQSTIKHEKWPHKCIKEFQAYGFCIQAAQLDVYNLHRFPSVRVARAPSSSSNRHII